MAKTNREVVLERWPDARIANHHANSYGKKLCFAIFCGQFTRIRITNWCNTEDEAWASAAARARGEENVNDK